MVRVIKASSVAVIMLLASMLSLYGQSNNFKVAKNLEIQTAILRALSSQYVDSVKVDSLVSIGINAMLESLDPYTVFIPEEDEDDLEMMTTGSYGGVGALIKKIPSGEVMISQPYFGSPAIKCGLEPGDKILFVEGVNTKDLTVSQCSSKMRGRPGTELNMKIKKSRNGDTLDVKLIRERVHVSDVVYSGFINDTTGYIQIGGFTLDGSKDVRRALEVLKEGGKMKRLVLDLRGNGGGLMPEAIDIVSIFVPTGTLVVSSKGREDGINVKYHTQKDPIDTNIPMLVMVNSGSASSSEIVAGALQDLDRAIIAGTRTFGKGLIQSLKNVGYNTSLKLTTGKYYTPSGRCVQAIDYSHRNEDGSIGSVPDSLKKEFKTKNGRSVYDGGGITPDIIIEPKYYSRPLISLIYRDIISDYAIAYYAKHSTIPPAGKFVLTDKEYDDFVAFASSCEFDSRTESQVEMENVIKAAKREGLFDDIKNLEQEMTSLKNKVSLSKEMFLKTNKEDIKPLVENEIALKYYFNKGGAESAVRNDDQLIKALKEWK